MVRDQVVKLEARLGRAAQYLVAINSSKSLGRVDERCSFATYNLSTDHFDDAYDVSTYERVGRDQDGCCDTGIRRSDTRSCHTTRQSGKFSTSLHEVLLYPLR